MSLFETPSQYGKNVQKELSNFAQKSTWHTSWLNRADLKKEQKCHYYPLYIQVF